MAKFHDHLTSYWYSRVCQYVKGLLIKPLTLVKYKQILKPLMFFFFKISFIWFFFQTLILNIAVLLIRYQINWLQGCWN